MKKQDKNIGLIGAGAWGKNHLRNLYNLGVLHCVLETSDKIIEQRIKELGNHNLNYRVSKEYILDEQNVRSAREALLRRILAVENIAATGQAALNPEALMYNVNQFGGGE